MLTSSSLLLFVLLVVRCSSLVACWFHSPLFFFFLALLLLPYVILWKKTLPIRLPPPFLLQKPVPLFSFENVFFSALYELYFWNGIFSPLRVSCPLCQVPPFFKWFDRCSYHASFLFRSYSVLVLEKGQKWDAGWLLPFHRRCHRVIHLPTISFLMPSLKSAEKAHHWLSFYFFSFLLFSPFFLYFFKKNKTK